MYTPKKLQELYQDKIEHWKNAGHPWHINYLLINLAQTYNHDDSLAEFASFVDIHSSTLSRWFNEKERKPPTRQRILKIAQSIANNPTVQLIEPSTINNLLVAIKEQPLRDEEFEMLRSRSAKEYLQEPLDETSVKNLLELLNNIPLQNQAVLLESLYQAGATGDLERIIDNIVSHPDVPRFVEWVGIERKSITIRRHLTPEEVDLAVKWLCGRKPSMLWPKPMQTFKTHISQLDNLLDGGLQIPRGQGLSVVLNGPPGAGKSTLALLIAIAWAKQGGHSLYCALEQASDGLAHIAQSFGYSLSESKDWKWIQGREASTEWPKGGAVKIVELMTLTFNSRLREVEGHLKKMQSDLHGLVVIDSLNVFTGIQSYRSDVLRLKKLLERRGIITIFILESGASASNPDAMEQFVADAVIELDTTFDQGYFLRTLQIKKNRYQFHALGKHIFKIYPTGVQIFPSLHFLLSVARRKEKQEVKEIKYIKTGVSTLDILLDGKGIKTQTTTALLGPVGNHKKAIALSFLAQGMIDRESCVLFSLTSEPEGVPLLPIFIGDKPFNWKDPEVEQRFKIESFRPGFITPEEFIDRVLQRIQATNAQPITRVVFDGVSHLPLRFPLVAASNIFLPTLTDIFRSYGITSIFVGVTKEDRADSLNQGLLVMADNAFILNRPQGDDFTQFQILKLAGHFADHRPRLLKEEGGKISIAELEKSSTL